MPLHTIDATGGDKLIVEIKEGKIILIIFNGAELYKAEKPETTPTPYGFPT